MLQGLHSLFRFALITSVMVCLYGPTCLLAADQQSDSKMMPAHYQDISFALTRNQLKALRPVKGFMESDTHSPKVFIEKASSPYFQTVLYGFKEEDSRIDWIAFVGELPIKNFQAYQHQLVRGAINKWGTNYQAFQTTNALVSATPQISLVWQKAVATICVSMPSDLKSLKRPVEIRIASLSVGLDRMIPQRTVLSTELVALLNEITTGSATNHQAIVPFFE